MILIALGLTTWCVLSVPAAVVVGRMFSAGTR